MTDQQRARRGHMLGSLLRSCRTAAMELTYWCARAPSEQLLPDVHRTQFLRQDCISIWSYLTQADMYPEEFEDILAAVNRPLHATIPVPEIPAPASPDMEAYFSSLWTDSAALPVSRLALLVASCAAAALHQMLHLTGIVLASPATQGQQKVFEHIDLWALSMLAASPADMGMVHRARALMSKDLDALEYRARAHWL
jgi:hypothetical protein